MDGRGVLAYLVGAAGAVVVGRWQASNSHLVSDENEKHADRSRRRIWPAARSVLVGVALGLLLFAVWYCLASREELVDAGGYFGMFVGMGLFGGSVAAVLVTFLAGTGDGQRRM
jgi:drug/metabolite transporter (DMT)-like permease